MVKYKYHGLHTNTRIKYIHIQIKLRVCDVKSLKLKICVYENESMRIGVKTKIDDDAKRTKRTEEEKKKNIEFLFATL